MQALLMALDTREPRAVERAVPGAWSANLISEEEADVLAGSDREAAVRRAWALAAAWPR